MGRGGRKARELVCDQLCVCVNGNPGQLVVGKKEATYFLIDFDLES